MRNLQNVKPIHLILGNIDFETNSTFNRYDSKYLDHYLESVNSLMEQVILDQYLVKSSNFVDSYEIVQHNESETSKARYQNTNDLVIIRTFHSINGTKSVDDFKKYIRCIIDLKHPCIIPFIGYILPDDNYNQSCSIVTKYVENESLHVQSL